MASSACYLCRLLCRTCNCSLDEPAEVKKQQKCRSELLTHLKTQAYSTETTSAMAITAKQGHMSNFLKSTERCSKINFFSFLKFVFTHMNTSTRNLKHYHLGKELQLFLKNEHVFSTRISYSLTINLPKM